MILIFQAGSILLWSLVPPVGTVVNNLPALPELFEHLKDLLQDIHCKTSDVLELLLTRKTELAFCLILYSQNCPQKAMQISSSMSYITVYSNEINRIQTTTWWQKGEYWDWFLVSVPYPVCVVSIFILSSTGSGVSLMLSQSESLPQLNLSFLISTPRFQELLVK